MSRIPLLLLFLTAWLAVFGQTQFAPVVWWTGTPLCVLPALTIYAALSHPLGVVAGFSIFAGLALDSISANRLGVSILPLFLCGFVTHARQHLILRDQAYARFWLGLGAGVAVPLLTRLLLSLGQRSPLGDVFGSSIAVSAIVNALACPLLFLGFDRFREVFEYKPMIESSFRQDRQLKRSRR
jgi:rod shape-determining protein MreD